MEPGHIIKFYMPGKLRNDEWVRVAIVYSSNSKFIPVRYHIHTTFHCPLPNDLPVRIVGKLAGENYNKYVILPGQRYREIQRYNLQDSTIAKAFVYSTLDRFQL